LLGWEATVVVLESVFTFVQFLIVAPCIALTAARMPR
jgi:hypothetical protein